MTHPQQSKWPTKTEHLVFQIRVTAHLDWQQGYFSAQFLRKL